ncbi:multicopper oxidase family protein [Iamia sp. SCSIO 61187]|uniref:multicopper oxidase family protein n=1 Tax=Iamia sp. SCSIO 61187 TaxID=2722752 RepID=UPI001C636E38|nr:multicopper oxidase family protein [Iamia sp. SCSIO 61187]
MIVTGVWGTAVRPWQEAENYSVIGATDPAVAAAEAERRTPGASVQDVALTAAPTTFTIEGAEVETWAFNGAVPGPEVRVQAGDIVRAEVRNELPEPLTIHWHGIALRNDMDGVPDLTQDAIEPAETFTYEFTAPDPGTYFFHPHTGTQLDRGLYAPFIVEDPSQPGGDDVVVMIDDWVDGTGRTPDDVLDELLLMPAEGDMGHDMSEMGGDSPTPPMDHGDMPGTTSADQPLVSDTGDVDYPFYLINGRPPSDPAEYEVTPGEPVRLRLINAGSDTPFRVAVVGAQLTVVATDGFPVEPVDVDTLFLGMGERYDVEVTIDEVGAVPLVAEPLGKPGEAVALLRTGPGAAPPADISPTQLGGRILALSDLRAASEVRLPAAPVDRDYSVELTGGMAPYAWGIAGTSDGALTLPVRDGDRVRLTIDNGTEMLHPIHLHGHTFQVVTDAGDGPRKDTLIVSAMSRITVELDADNPGQWVLHCHNIYHAEVGMMTVLTYVR